jgi:hypothetical protein
MENLKHKILQHLVEHGELNIKPADHKFPKVDREELDVAAQELDQAGLGVYTRTLDRLFLNKSAKTKKALEDHWVYSDEPVADVTLNVAKDALSAKKSADKPAKKKP